LYQLLCNAPWKDGDHIRHDQNPHSGQEGRAQGYATRELPSCEGLIDENRLQDEQTRSQDVAGRQISPAIVLACSSPGGFCAKPQRIYLATTAGRRIVPLVCRRRRSPNATRCDRATRGGSACRLDGIRGSRPVLPWSRARLLARLVQSPRNCRRQRGRFSLRSMDRTGSAQAKVASPRAPS
jgi:hypothetical protein